MFRRSTNEGFTIKQTNIAKGIACILLLCHHLFYSEASYDRFVPLFFWGGDPIESVIARMCKVCVTIFLILSGYGVNETINKRLATSVNHTKTLIRTSGRLIWKLWLGYVVVFVLFVPWQGLFDRQVYHSFFDVVLDTVGIAYVTSTPTMNQTWWFMSVAIISYMLTPLFKIMITKRKTLLLAVVPLSFVLYFFKGSVFWCYAFLIGMIISEFNLFNILQSKFAHCNPIYTWSVCGISVLVTGVWRYVSVDFGDFLFAISIIVFAFLCVSQVKIFSVPLELLGKHSANIFFFHSFIYAHNFTEFVYAPRYAPLILLLFVVECLLISIMIEYIKKITFIKKGGQYIEKAIGGELDLPKNAPLKKGTQ